MPTPLLRFALIAMVLFFGFANSGAAQERGVPPDRAEIGKTWRLLGETDFSTVFLDHSRIFRVDSDRADVWLYLELRSRSPSPGGWFDRTVDHVRVNCATTAIEGLFSTTWYDKNAFIKTMGTGVLQPLPATTNTRPMAEQVCAALRS